MQKEGILTLGLMVIFNTSFSAESMNSNMLKLAASGAQAAYLSHVGFYEANTAMEDKAAAYLKEQGYTIELFGDNTQQMQNISNVGLKPDLTYDLEKHRKDYALFERNWNLNENYPVQTYSNANNMMGSQVLVAKNSCSVPNYLALIVPR
ncbi:hypothetical protein [Cysteiniphilum sp. 6C5]|uniref:hypothetical protein n=1 Tax=unclassified Cysteiniphilum TaxID=2610889 RepID=UPI003F86E34E